MNEEEKTVQDAYIAYYGRPADPGGLAFWMDKLTEAGGNLDELLVAFGDSDEFTRRFGDLDNEELVHMIYQRLFGRDADPEGLAFYLGLLERGEASLASIALDILNGSRGEDLVLLNKIRNVAERFTRLVEDAGLDYNGPKAEQAGANAVNIFHSEWYGHWLAKHGDFTREGLLIDPGFTVEHGRLKHENWAPLLAGQLYEHNDVIDIDRHHDVGHHIDDRARFRWGERDEFTWQGSFSPDALLNPTEINGLRDDDQVTIHDAPAGTWLLFVDFQSELPPGADETDLWFIQAKGYETANWSDSLGRTPLADRDIENKWKDDETGGYRFTLPEEGRLQIHMEGWSADGERYYEWTLRHISDEIEPTTEWYWSGLYVPINDLALSFYDEYIL